MNKRQKSILTESIIIIIITALAVAGMVNLKQWGNRTETIKVMQQLGHIVLQYRKEHGLVPSEGDIKGIQDKLQGDVNLDELQYRAECLDADSTPDEILAYIERRFHASLVSKGYVVLQLNGAVVWMNKEEFKQALSRQRRLSPHDVQILQDL
ncbi:MAG: hypothetical protein A2167_07810 [Planctomycetes bacterium RBG_13_46_10]|nr:MAG: hypothetical protein A2167_07810 [Planctomycetes bacterium RBG_13_46_10]